MAEGGWLEGDQERFVGPGWAVLVVGGAPRVDYADERLCGLIIFAR